MQIRIANPRPLLWTAAAMLLAGALAAVVLAISLPFDAAQITPVSPAPATQAASKARMGPTLEQLAEVWSRDLHQPLDGRSSPSTQTAAGNGDGGELRLVGTIVEAGHSYAMLVGGDGQVQVKHEGEMVGEYEVVQILQRSVQLRNGDRALTLQLPEAP